MALMTSRLNSFLLPCLTSISDLIWACIVLATFSNRFGDGYQAWNECILTDQNVPQKQSSDPNVKTTIFFFLSSIIPAYVRLLGLS